VVPSSTSPQFLRFTGDMTVCVMIDDYDDDDNNGGGAGGAVSG
jgi:Fe-S-cluster formation regulator IscX/YfhJ